MYGAYVEDATQNQTLWKEELFCTANLYRPLGNFLATEFLFHVRDML
jgi:hypothetical protein